MTRPCHRCHRDFEPTEPKNYSGDDMRLCPDCKKAERNEEYIRAWYCDHGYSPQSGYRGKI